jgi:hypothetical protein
VNALALSRLAKFFRALTDFESGTGQNLFSRQAIIPLSVRGTFIPLSVRGTFGLEEYRAYTVGSGSHFIGFEALTCRDDDEAVARAKRLVDGYDVELWSGARFIIRLTHKPK